MLLLSFCSWLDDLVSEDPTVVYDKATNKVIVPMALLSYPYFETGFPEWVNN